MQVVLTILLRGTSSDYSIIMNVQADMEIQAYTEFQAGTEVRAGTSMETPTHTGTDAAADAVEQAYKDLREEKVTRKDWASS